MSTSQEGPEFRIESFRVGENGEFLPIYARLDASHTIMVAEVYAGEAKFRLDMEINDSGTWDAFWCGRVTTGIDIGKNRPPGASFDINDARVTNGSDGKRYWKDSGKYLSAACPSHDKNLDAELHQELRELVDKMDAWFMGQAQVKDAILLAKANLILKGQQILSRQEKYFVEELSQAEKAKILACPKKEIREMGIKLLGKQAKPGR